MSGKRLVFLSTPSGWRATSNIMLSMSLNKCISIHALRVEGDQVVAVETRITPFLSTPSGWRATTKMTPCVVITTDFYPRPPGGGRRLVLLHHHRLQQISIHALRVEGDAGYKVGYTTRFAFLSTPSGWRATSSGVGVLVGSGDFYPRPPGGGRQQKRTKFSSVFAQKGEEFASLRRGKRKICRWRFKKDKFWVLIWCEGSGKSVCALVSHCG